MLLAMIKWVMTALYLWVLASMFPNVFVEKTVRQRFISFLVCAMQVMSILFVWIW